VKQMTAHNDVMRSDRLKQVMQEIDPTFDEKNYGFSRFSKFVSEAASKGLIHLTKLDSGQFEVALGAGVAEPAADRAGGPREPREREKPREARPPREPRRGLGEAFGLLKQALGRFGGDKPVPADELRDTMVELKGGESAQLEPEKFPGLLRKAHDAEIIDLSKEDDGAYAVKLREEAARRTERLPERQPDVVSEPVMDAEPRPAAEAHPAAGAAPAVPARSARFRRGSRGGAPRAGAPEVPKIGVVEVDPNYTPPPRQEYVPPRTDPVVRPVSSAPVVPAEGERGERPERGDRGESRGRRRGGRGGRGRRADGGDRERADRPPRSDRGPREERSEGERGGRSRRGGGGRGRGEQGASDDTPRSEPRPAPEPKGAPAAKPPAAPDHEGEGFWSRVKRGLTGGA
jgi:OST-HTH/LOTUS domain-containing protein